ncbi:MAG: hypothetical protein RAO92_04580 [Candidatus Euphemobacter frigidus]|nr:hypothetical protein [Candidatus Euphemobacter frigidus]MDP8275663.1 hypothetical protein [Candidatus Euphemobacter frigidus]
MKEKLLAKRLKTPLNRTTKKRIESKLKKLKRDDGKTWKINYHWENSDKENSDKLVVATAMLKWEAVFTRKSCTVYIDVPLLLRPMLFPFRNRTVKILTEEISGIIG